MMARMDTLLMIEDDHRLAQMVSAYLQQSGFAVHHAATAEEGLTHLQTSATPVALVLLDLMLPKLNGIEILNRARATPEFRALPIIVFSNAYMTTVIDAAWQAGATVVLTKSNTSPKKLTETIHELLAKAAATPAKPRPLGVETGLRLLDAHLTRSPPAYVERVVSGSPADRAGVQIGRAHV